MLRAFFMLLVAWPLLMPPGLCICRLEAFSPRPAGGQGVAAAQGQDGAPPTRGCRCCRNSAARDASPSKTSSCSNDQSPTPCPQDQHAPACPASPEWQVTRASVVSLDGSVLCDFLADALTASWVRTDLACLSSPSPAWSSDHLPTSCPSLFSCNFRC